jgi:hypothetical protein
MMVWNVVSHYQKKCGLVVWILKKWMEWSGTSIFIIMYQCVWSKENKGRMKIKEIAMSKLILDYV